MLFCGGSGPGCWLGSDAPLDAGFIADQLRSAGSSVLVLVVFFCET